MPKDLKRLERRKKSINRMGEIFNESSTSLVIHYSCESYYGKTDGKTPRITSIAVRNLSSGQTISFSIHKVAEERNIIADQIAEQYDELEKQMLDEFFDFVSKKENHNWIHWNMRDINYGFSALEHRHRVLKGSPFEIAESRKFDLSRALIDIYGVSYISHPRLESLVKLNRISPKDFMTGEQEADAFEQKRYVSLHQSTLRKVDTIANVFDRAINQKLKTNATLATQYGSRLSGIIETIKDNSLYKLFCILSTLGIFGALYALWGKFV